MLLFLDDSLLLDPVGTFNHTDRRVLIHSQVNQIAPPFEEERGGVVWGYRDLD